MICRYTNGNVAFALASVDPPEYDKYLYFIPKMPDIDSLKLIIIAI